LGFGLFHDDYVHRSRLQQADWTFSDLVYASRLGTTTRMVRFWWALEEQFWQPFRPISFGLMKGAYTLGDWRPGAMHGVSLAWHWLNAMLVALVADRLLGRRGWATVAGIVFAIHPGHVLAVHWIACQTELIVTSFLLGCLLFHRRSMGWPTGIILRLNSEDQIEQRPVTWPALTGAWLCFVAALGCRENAIVFPAVLLSFDVLIHQEAASRGWGSLIRRLWPAYLGFAVIGVAFLILRNGYLQGLPPTGRPHLVPPGDPEFFRFLADKFMLYWLALYAFVPSVQVGVFDGLRSHPALLYGAGVATIVYIVSLVWFCCRGRRVVWALMAWPIIALLPVLPVFAGQHHMYWPLAGVAVLSGAIGARLTDLEQSIKWMGKTRFGRSLTVFALVGFAAGSWIGGRVFLGTVATEHRWMDELTKNGEEIRDGDHLFIVDFPALAAFATPGIEESLGVKNLTLHALTVCPSVDARESQTEVQVTGERRLRVSAKGDAYFSGELGRTVLQVGGRRDPLNDGDAAGNEIFDVTVIETSERGVLELDFTFLRPLTSKGFHFFTAGNGRSCSKLHLTTAYASRLATKK
jgi:hypothetical protein